MKISIKSSIIKDTKFLEALSKRQLPFVLARTITGCASNAQKALREAIPKAFDRPTPYTMRSIKIKMATKKDLVADVHVEMDGKRVPPGKYLEPEIYKGGRSDKGLEVALRKSGLLPANMQAAPAKGLGLNQYGNVTGGVVRQIISQLQNANADGTTRSRSRNKKRARYFVVSKQKGKLRPGIYARRGSKHGASISMMFAFVRKPRYNQRLDFFKIANAAIARTLDQELDKSLSFALKTARR